MKTQLYGSFPFVLFCCSDFRLCNRGLKECHISEETGELIAKTAELVTETVELIEEVDSIHSCDRDSISGSNNLVDTTFCPEKEKSDDVLFDGEFAGDEELMKSMGLPLSFTQASERRHKKVIRYSYNNAVSHLRGLVYFS